MAAGPAIFHRQINPRMKLPVTVLQKFSSWKMSCLIPEPERGLSKRKLQRPFAEPLNAAFTAARPPGLLTGPDNGLTSYRPVSQRKTRA